ncbi:MAG: hypothetical protein EOO27_25490, partial [Comamonadaceae bacterium]
MNATASSEQQARTGMSFQHFPDYYRPYASLHNAWQLPDGSSLVMGATYSGSYQTFLYKLTPEGALDPRFAASGTVPGILHGLELTPGANRPLSDVEFVDVGPDGSVWVLFNTADYSGPVHVRLSSDGSLDPSFNAEGPVPGTLDIALDPFSTGIISIDALGDGSLRVATFTRHEDDGVSRYEIEVLRIDAQGQQSSEVSLQLGDASGLSRPAISYLADGSMLLQAQASAGGATLLARVDAQGNLDASFNSEGSPAGVLVVPGGAQWLALPDGALLQIDQPRFNPSDLTLLTPLTLTRRDADGSIDAVFSASDALGLLTQGLHFSPSTFEVLALDDGKLIVAIADGLGVRLSRMNADGSLDASFNAEGATPGIAQVALDPIWGVDSLDVEVGADGTITLSGSQLFFNFSARLLADGTLDTAYGALPGQPGTTVAGDLLSAAATQTLIGGLGLDWAEFEGALADHRISVSWTEPWSGNAWSVAANDASTSVWTHGVERLRFDDLSLAVDTAVFYQTPTTPGGWPTQGDWDHAGSTAAIVAALWGADALKDRRLVGEVLAYVDTLGDVSTINRLMATPETFGIRSAANAADWLQLMHSNLLGRQADPERLQQMLEESKDYPTLVQVLMNYYEHDDASLMPYQALRELLLPFGEYQRGLVHQEYEGLIFGTSQNDRFDARAIDDRIDGGVGLDRVVYGHAANTVTVDRLDDGALRVQGPGDTMELLWNIERLRFADITLAFDLAEGQSANQAARVV